MKTVEKRIFISDLPETASDEEIKNVFGEYGKVNSIEIKERKELGPKNKSLFFAYVNIEIDDSNLQKCFKDFAQNEWHGYCLRLQIARESFLDRLKREREENEKKSMNNTSASNTIKTKNENSKIVEVKIEDIKEEPEIKYEKEVKQEISSSSDESDEEEKVDEKPEEKLDLIIKNNKGKSLDRSLPLRIPSVGNSPIIKIERTPKKVVNNSEDNLKRLQSLNAMKQGYKSQKLVIQSALAKIDVNKSSKINFNIKEDELNESSGKNRLFDDDSSDGEDFSGNFNVKEQFTGKEGQKLLELQSKYKNDKRFQLDERFLQNNVNDEEKEIKSEVEDEEMTFEQEKMKEYEILEQIIGKKVQPRQKMKERPQKEMLRFDPNNPEHEKFLVKNDQVAEETKSKKKRKRKESDNETVTENDIPEVSKEVFYKVTDTLKESLTEKKEFSLLSMFGNRAEETEEIEEITATSSSNKETSRKSNGLLNGEKNPFQYDSSDDEKEEEEDLQKLNKDETPAKEDSSKTRLGAGKLWTESFFFKNDDYRLQEGFDFVERMKGEESQEFSKLRRNLKQIVRAKVRNNQKNKPFKKKLGGNRKRKMIRIKKALKR